MKKLFLIVAAMFAAVSFSACSDDDDNGHVSDKPVLVKQCIITEEYGETDIVYFEYDSQNRICHSKANRLSAHTLLKELMARKSFYFLITKIK